jgi:hypothetical protein
VIRSKATLAFAAERQVVSRTNEMVSSKESDPVHPILADAWQYEIVGLRLEREPLDGSEPFLDLMLRCGDDRRTLRFWSPADLEIEKGGPSMTGGLAILDVRSRGLERIGVRVTDFEAGNGSVRFVARTVEDLQGAG